MSGYTAMRIDEMDSMHGGAMRLARASLGVTSFGMQVEEFPPGFDKYPEHNHDHDGQEEVYLVLRGSAEMEVDGDRVTLDPETIVRVGPGSKRRILPGPEGVRILALGGIPGAVYEAPEFTNAAS
jgi:mannose-6-phosphate isomerase-like protein (cupin superfamily)